MAAPRFVAAVPAVVDLVAALVVAADFEWRGQHFVARLRQVAGVAALQEVAPRQGLCQ